MTRRHVLLWLSIAVAAIVVDLAILQAPDVGVPRWAFAPIVLAGLFGLYLCGVRASKGESLRSRVLCGAVWTAPWMLLLCLPLGLLSGGYAAERLFTVRPPGDYRNLSSGEILGGKGPMSVGFVFSYTTNAQWPEIEEHFHERLTRRGWRHVWTREFIEPPVGAAPGDPLPRWMLFRRFDGQFFVCLGTRPDGLTIVENYYQYLEWDVGDTSDYLRQDNLRRNSPDEFCAALSAECILQKDAPAH